MKTNKIQKDKCIYCGKEINIQTQPWNYFSPGKMFHNGCALSLDLAYIPTRKINKPQEELPEEVRYIGEDVVGVNVSGTSSMRVENKEAQEESEDFDWKDHRNNMDNKPQEKNKEAQEDWKREWRKLQYDIDWIGYNYQGSEDPEELMENFIEKTLKTQREQARAEERRTIPNPSYSQAGVDECVNKAVEEYKSNLLKFAKANANHGAIGFLKMETLISYINK